ncbi:N-acetylglucosaminylphosphatidylinositol deacetylase [Sporothrix brasiliensis 5110]|uniref:N-acetylglucosaminylphosphatidylinositol deacetylase n=1 Tax=Sporothrix brasiliensis 5110 TaxID=1398154 RepID=A0A0C2IRU2_9PEZI|nr:N-acetylglucosaminylphosphatidylinositol deacetylase [Sporothrix brasiliensis 5110]KIH87712.1 N-acetylglucosaminylphosphatidylinositol deacetylase [Sporothrix brasiliensis 5110]
MSLLSLLGALVVLVPVLYMYTVSVVGGRFPTLRNKRICLLIAHPDDEAMFFAPSVLALTRPETGNHVKILCLSSGNAEGLGETRKRELVKSAMTLGLRHEDDVFVVDSPDFPDSMTTEWDSQTIATLLASAFTPPGPGAPDQPPAATIDVLLTFDDRGVSGHPNHISLYRGARRFVASLVQGKPGWRPPVDLYTLTTVSLLRKYTWVFDLLPTVVSWGLRLGSKGTSAAKIKEHPPALVYLADLNPTATGGGLGTAWRAMTTAHQSQMVWFRYGWIALSRYMVMNDLQLQHSFGPNDMKKP